MRNHVWITPVTNRNATHSKHEHIHTDANEGTPRSPISSKHAAAYTSVQRQSHSTGDKHNKGGKQTQ